MRITQFTVVPFNETPVDQNIYVVWMIKYANELGFAGITVSPSSFSSPCVFLPLQRRPPR